VVDLIRESSDRTMMQMAGLDDEADMFAPVSKKLCDAWNWVQANGGELARTVQAVVGYEGDVVFDPSKPDGTPRKLMDVGKLARNGWQARTALADGMARAYDDFLATVPR